MSNYSTNDPGAPRTPIFDQTVTATAVHVDTDHDRPSDGADQAKQAAGQAKDTAKQAAGQAKEQAQQVGSTAADAGQRVASTTKDQAAKVASNAADQARELYGQATSQLSEQAGKQQKNAASALRSFGEDLSSMHQQHDGGGLAADLVQNLSTRAGHLSDWLDRREPSEVLDEVTQFAARRPGLFIGLAAVAGIVVARASKALVAEAKQDHAPAAVQDAQRTTGRPMADPYGSADLGGGSTSGTSGYGTTGYGTTGTSTGGTFGSGLGDPR